MSHPSHRSKSVDALPGSLPSLRWQLLQPAAAHNDEAGIAGAGDAAQDAALADIDERGSVISNRSKAIAQLLEMFEDSDVKSENERSEPAAAAPAPVSAAIANEDRSDSSSSSSSSSSSPSGSDSSSSSSSSSGSSCSQRLCCKS